MGGSRNFSRVSFAKERECLKIEYFVQKIYSFNKSEFLVQPFWFVRCFKGIFCFKCHKKICNRLGHNQGDFQIALWSKKIKNSIFILRVLFHSMLYQDPWALVFLYNFIYKLSKFKLDSTYFWGGTDRTFGKVSIKNI